MVVGTTEAARILKISTARLRVLLSAGRVEGAYKTGKMWLIPLFKGEPTIKRGTRGPAPRWCNLKKRAKTIVHVNSHRIRQNQKQQQQLPVITVKTRNTNTYGHIVEIPGGCRVVYCPDKPLPCGARVWIETFYDVNVIGQSKSLDLPTLL
ncbi:DNA-binding protein [Capilliphycus salinus ALCB114379]|uniref:DNA-binding protein n=1 Tax=Capilliphycus salinus TaxID=2768948 RepID=UPI0039A73FB9